MIVCKSLNKEFNSKEELFKALRENHDAIVGAKKAQILKSCEKGSSITAKPLDSLKLGSQIKEINVDSNYYYIAVNSTKILDGHLDLHLDGLWKKSVKEQQGKVYLVSDHKLELDKTIAKKEHVEIFTAIVPFAMIGKSYPGDTEILIYKIKKDKVINPVAKAWLDSGDEIEASVRMQYIDIIFAMDSNLKEDVKFKKNYDDLYSLIANKDEFENDIIYFWGIKQARNVYESSLVLFGSNSGTGQLFENNKDQPLKDADKTIEPSKDTQQKEFYRNLN